MSVENYHHGDLKKSLIEAGIKLINENGVENFSLRKVAAMCNVSHAAPYNHFKNKKELIKAIIEHVELEFANALYSIIEKYEKPSQEQIIELGKKYVSFMVENPDYFRFLFLGYVKHNISFDNMQYESHEFNAFNIFRNTAINYLKSINISKEDYNIDIITMWTMVHGIAVMLVNNTIKTDLDYNILVERIITEKLKF